MSSNQSVSPVIVITGASRGLGRALALRCGRERWRVVVHYRERAAEAAAVATAVSRAGGEALVHQADVTAPDAFPHLVERAVTRWGRIDAWVNNAGIVEDRLAVSAPEQAWDRMIATHLSAAWRATRAVAPLMREQRGGAILNVVSLAALQGRRGQSLYAAAKAGLIALTRTAARELGPDGIRVNAVCPPVLDTDSTGPRASALRAQQLIPDAVSTDQAAEAMFAVLALPWMSGQTVVLDSRLAAGSL